MSAFLALQGAGAAPFEMQGESLVLHGTAEARLGFGEVLPGSVAVRSTYLPAISGTVTYEEGKDYRVDLAAGTIARTAESRIPDFTQNVLFGQKQFDHSKFPGYGNLPFFVYVDYQTNARVELAPKSEQRAALAKTREKLAAGGPFKVITFGDSISAGGEASARDLRFDERYVRALRERFPAAEVNLENGATGGDATPQGLARLEEKVLTRAPDLVLVGFGMNDHNVNGVSPEDFEGNLISIVEQIRARTGAEVLLFSAFPPNPDWKHGANRMEVYAAATQRAALQTGAAFADVFAVWQKILERKDLPSMLANNINHPNDFGHWLYFQALDSVEF